MRFMIHILQVKSSTVGATGVTELILQGLTQQSIAGVNSFQPDLSLCPAAQANAEITCTNSLFQAGPNRQ